jgi:hypothetical protein
MENQQYDVQTYTDLELFQLMDLNNPTDRELEAKIYSLIDKYEISNNKLSMKMCKFFTDVFLHFFSSVDDDKIEGFEVKGSDKANETSQPLTTQPLTTQPLTTQPLTTQSLTTQPLTTQPLTTQPLTTVTTSYSKGLLNPLLKETIRRIVCVDSQFRDLSVYPNSTNFTFNLSDTLLDVVSLKLYSVQIPYTWYTISNEFGSNFFILKGNVDGIDNGNFDFKVEIDPGNYLASDFTKYISAALKTIALNNIDVDFNSTSVSYNTINSKLTIDIDIKILYNETNYEVQFIDNEITTVGNNKTTTLRNLLGFEKKTEYFPFSVKSAQHTIPQSNVTVTELNNFFYLHLYQGIVVNNKILDNATHSSYIKTLEFKLTTGLRDLSGIINDINEQIKSNTYIDSSNSSFVYDSIYRRFIMKIRLDRKTFRNLINYKTAIEFPSDSKIWLGELSLFKFDVSFNELNQIISENNNLKTLYEVGTDSRIDIKSKISEFSYIDKYVSIESGYYTTVQLNSLINTEFAKLNLTTNNNFDLSFNVNVSNLPQVSCVISKTLPFINSSTSGSHFTVNINNSILSTFLKFTSDSINNAEVDSDDVITITSNIFNIEQEVLVEQSEKIVIVFSNPLTSTEVTRTIALIEPGSYSLRTIVDTINSGFESYNDDTYRLSLKGSKVNISFGSTASKGTLKLKIRILFTNKDFILKFTDNKNLWTTYLGFNESYDLSNNVVGSVPFINNLMYLNNLNNYFSIKPIYDVNGGVYTSNELYAIIIRLTLDTNRYYTREDIITNINAIFQYNALTTGSYATSYEGKTTIKLNINKIFNGLDYRIVFFDNTFTRCKYGMSSIDNVKWDTTLGWVLGFRSKTEYSLADSVENLISNNFSYNATTNITSLTSDTSININLYNYLLIVLDDYCQNHLNDGLVTVTKTDYDIPLPSYANRTTYQCNSSGELSIVNSNLTSKQIYSANQILQAKNVNQKKSIYSSGPFTQDIFALIPIKTSGLSIGQTFVDFSGTLQNQERSYFGPVNIKKITVQLLNDKGTTLDLNGANWSFSFISEQLYNPSRN